MGKIYTRKGDKGKTALANGRRVLKSDLRIEILGTIDELNSLIGVVLSIKYLVLSIKQELIKVQNDLLSIGSNITRPATYYILHTTYYKNRIKEFEDLIDQMTEKMPRLSNFILPGRGKEGAMLHLARAVCRRLERRIVQFKKIDNSLIIYFNRLSDLLFTMARFANFKERKKEIVWRKND